MPPTRSSARAGAPPTTWAPLTSFRRAIRAHRRVARLAQRFFDSVLLERKRREHEARRLWLDSCHAALLKVYMAPYPTRSRPFPTCRHCLSPRTQLAVERELASCRAWLAIGGDALRRFQVRAPHPRVSFSRLVRLIETATALGRLATGADLAQPQTEPSIYSNAWADLQRIYGDDVLGRTGPLHLSLK